MERRGRARIGRGDWSDPAVMALSVNRGGMTCRRIGCGKDVLPGMGYCSAACAPLASLSNRSPSRQEIADRLEQKPVAGSVEGFREGLSDPRPIAEPQEEIEMEERDVVEEIGMTIQEAAEEAGKSAQTIRNWVRAGLPTSRDGQKMIISRAALRKFIDGGEGNPKDAVKPPTVRKARKKKGEVDPLEQSAMIAKTFVTAAQVLRAGGRRKEERLMLWMAVQELGLVEATQ